MREINAVKFYPRVMCMDPAGDIIQQNLPTSTVYAIAAMMEGQWSIDFFKTEDRPMHVLEEQFVGIEDYDSDGEILAHEKALKEEGWICLSEDDYDSFVRETNTECVPYRWIKSCPVDGVTDWWKSHVMLIDKDAFGEEFYDDLCSDRASSKYILKEYGHVIEWMAKYEGNTRRLNEENAREYYGSTKVVDVEE